MERFLDRPFSFLERNLVVTTILFFIIALLVRYLVSFLSWHLLNFPLQRYDPYIYLLKSLEIVSGDWSPIKTHALGWPIFLSGFFYFVRSQSVFENFVYASFVATFVSSAIIFPLSYLGSKLIDSRRALIVLLFSFILAFGLILPEYDSIVISEFLFVFIFLTSLCFLLRSQKYPRSLFWASGLAALAYWVRPNGFIILPILLVSFWLWRRKQNSWRTLLYVFGAVLVFGIISAPFLYQRVIYFGSPFDYGENSKYLSDSLTSAWGAYFPNISFLGYLLTHGAYDFLKKFIFGGFIFVMIVFAYAVLPHILTSIYEIISSRLRDERLYPIWATFIIWSISLVPVFHIFYTPRHIVPLVPLAIILSVIGFRDFIVNKKIHNIFLTIFIVAQIIALVVYISVFLIMTKDKYMKKNDAFKWAPGLAVKLKGRVAMADGQDILMAFLSDTRVGGRSMLNLYAPQSRLEVIYPGKVKDISELTNWFHWRGIDYVVLDDRVPKELPLVPDKHLTIYTGEKFPEYFEEVYSNYDSNSQWKIRVFRINYPK